MAVQASLVWPKIDEILEFADFSDLFFSYHHVVSWNGRETLPATQDTLPQQSWSPLADLRSLVEDTGNSYPVSSHSVLIKPTKSSDCSHDYLAVSDMFTSRDI